MMTWETVSNVKHEDGTQTIRYELKGTGYAVESRKAAIPHSGRSGTWHHTTYYLIFPDGQEKQFYMLALAKKTAEAIAGAGR
jgi:hypothetical protein